MAPKGYWNQSRGKGTAWNDTNKALYNSYLRINFQSTRFLDPHTLRVMSIYPEVFQMLRRMGLDTLAFQHYPLYKELAIQFFASVELHHQEGCLRDPNRAYVSFTARGIVYRVHVTYIYEAFGFSVEKEDKYLPRSESWALWRKIRNPRIPVVAKIIGNLLMGKEEVGSFSSWETVLLHYRLSRDIDIYVYLEGSPFPPTLDIIIWYMFVQMLVKKKIRALNMRKQKIEATANLLTPIFRAA